MSKTPIKHTNKVEKPEIVASTEVAGHHEVPRVVQKTRLEKTQSLLTIISTSLGLIGIAGSTFAFAASTFYTGSVDVRPDFETPGLVVKVYTSEGHQSIFHAKHINLMPGDYHLEICSPNGKVAHRDCKIKFHKNNIINVNLGPPPAESAETAAAAQALTAQGDGNANPASSIFGEQVTNGEQLAANQLAANPPAQNESLENQNSTTAAAENSASGAEPSKKKRWWKFWQRGN